MIFVQTIRRSTQLENVKSALNTHMLIHLVSNAFLMSVNCNNILHKMAIAPSVHPTRIKMNLEKLVPLMIAQFCNFWQKQENVKTVLSLPIKMKQKKDAWLINVKTPKYSNRMVHV